MLVYYLGEKMKLNRRQLRKMILSEVTRHFTAGAQHQRYADVLDNIPNEIDRQFLNNNYAHYTKALDLLTYINPRENKMPRNHELRKMIFQNFPVSFELRDDEDPKTGAPVFGNNPITAMNPGRDQRKIYECLKTLVKPENMAAAITGTDTTDYQQTGVDMGLYGDRYKNDMHDDDLF